MVGVLAKWGAVALAEGGQEGLQQFACRTSSPSTITSRVRICPEGVGKAAALGAAVGAVFGAAGIPGDIREHAEKRRLRRRHLHPASARGDARRDSHSRCRDHSRRSGPASDPCCRRLSQTMVVHDPAYVDESGVQQPAGPPHGMTVDVVKRGANMSDVRLRDRNGTVVRIGNALLATQDVTKDAVKAALQPPDDDRPGSPRLTETDRSSPIPSDIIDDGKALVEVATGQPSTITSAPVVDGKREVTQTPVADVVAADRAKTQAVINQILQGVAPAPAVAAGPLAAPPAGVPEVAGYCGPGQAPPL